MHSGVKYCCIINKKTAVFESSLLFTVRLTSVITQITVSHFVSNIFLLYHKT